MRNDKLGIAYNIFDGEEILPFSISAIRKEADYIAVVYQKISNAGEKAAPDLEDKLNELKRLKLADELYLYEPDLTKDLHFNEKKKRDIGLHLVKKAGCSYFLSMDCDEFYESEEFARAKKFIADNEIKSSAVSILEYLKKPEYLILNGYTFNHGYGNRYAFYVPFIMDITNEDLNGKKTLHGESFFPVLTDPTRTLNGALKFYLFPKHEIVMRHMSSVRDNLEIKYKNSSLNQRQDEETKLLIDEIKKDIIDFNFEKNKISNSLAIFRGLIIEKTDNIFNIKLQGETEDTNYESGEENASDLKYRLQSLKDKLLTAQTELKTIKESKSYKLASALASLAAYPKNLLLKLKRR